MKRKYTNCKRHGRLPYQNVIQCLGCGHVSQLAIRGAANEPLSAGTEWTTEFCKCGLRVNKASVVAICSKCFIERAGSGMLQ